MLTCSERFLNLYQQLIIVVQVHIQLLLSLLAVNLQLLLACLLKLRLMPCLQRPLLEQLAQVFTCEFELLPPALS